jgi:hypothetical protein
LKRVPPSAQRTMLPTISNSLSRSQYPQTMKITAQSWFRRDGPVRVGWLISLPTIMSITWEIMLDFVSTSSRWILLTLQCVAHGRLGGKRKKLSGAIRGLGRDTRAVTPHFRGLGVGI